MGLSRRPISKKILRLFLGLLLVVVQQTHAYADWLKCYVDLEDEEEIIMHKPILKVDDQSPEKKKVMIEIQPSLDPPRGASWKNATVQQHQELFPSSDPTLPTLLKARVRLPPSLQRPRKTVQFVLEAKGEGVSFVGPTSMCDGKRVAGQKGHVVLQIEPVSAVQGDIELLAAWAGGYEAVKLTQKLIVKRSGTLPGAANGAAESEL